MSPLAIFAGPYAVFAKWGVIALLVAAFAGFFWLKGNAHGTQKLTDYQGKQLVESVRIGAAREKVTQIVVDHYIKVKGDTKVVTETIEKEVLKYADANPGYCLDAGWRVRHDSAAANAVPAAGFSTDGALRASTSLTLRIGRTEGSRSAGDGYSQLRTASSLR